jgi:hypothetical protein
MTMMTTKLFTSKSAVLAGTMAIAAAMLSVMPAQAAEKTLTLTDKTNENTKDYPTVSVNLKEVSGGVQVSVNVVPSTAKWTGDLRAVWFNVPKASGVSVSGISGGPVTGISGASNATKQGVSNSADLNGMQASFNLGVEIGSEGMSAKGDPDDFQTATFTLSGVSLADFSSDMIGTRLMSVGPEGNREYSSKTGTAAIPGNNDSGTTGSTGGSTGDTTSTGGSGSTGGTTSTGGSGSTGDTTSTGGGGSGDGGGVVVSEAAPEPLTILGTMLGGGALVAARKRKANKAS